jgi:DnaJ-class molecular chaperone
LRHVNRRCGGRGNIVRSVCPRCGPDG